jgi:NAD+ synthase (glutamine-hydrolysing)
VRWGQAAGGGRSGCNGVQLRVAACTTRSTLADPARNVAAVVETAGACEREGVELAVFPELTLSGYSIEDLLLQDTLLDAVEEALAVLVAESTRLQPVLVIGAPLRRRHRIYNTAVIVHRGRVLGVSPKSYLPTYGEFYERRHTAAGDDQRGEIRLNLAGVRTDVAFGPNLLFMATDLPALVLHVEICEDMFVPIPPSAVATLAGATVLANLSASPVTVGKAAERQLLARSASARYLAAYLYSAAGEGESTTDLSWDGQVTVHQNGHLLAECDRFPRGPRRAVADLDLGYLQAERARSRILKGNSRRYDTSVRHFRTIEFTLGNQR